MNLLRLPLLFENANAMRRRLPGVGCMLAVMLLAVLSAAVQAAESFLEPGQAFVLTVDQADATGEVRLNWAVAPGYYLYRDRIGVTASPAGNLGKVVRPPGELKQDPNFGAMQVYHHDVAVTVDARGARELEVTWQGYAEAGLCYPPQTRKVALASNAAVAGPGTALTPTPTSPQEQTPSLASLVTSGGSSDTRFTQLLSDHSLLWTVPLFFLLGLALAFTPCVLPMVPIVSGIVVGSGAAPRRAFALSRAFVLPMALVYALLGVAAALAGANLQAVLQNRWCCWRSVPCSSRSRRQCSASSRCSCRPCCVTGSTARAAGGRAGRWPARPGWGSSPRCWSGRA